MRSTLALGDVTRRARRRPLWHVFDAGAKKDVRPNRDTIVTIEQCMVQVMVLYVVAVNWAQDQLIQRRKGREVGGRWHRFTSVTATLMPYHVPGDEVRLKARHAHTHTLERQQTQHSRKNSFDEEVHRRKMEIRRQRRLEMFVMSPVQPVEGLGMESPVARIEADINSDADDHRLRKKANRKELAMVQLHLPLLSRESREDRRHEKGIDEVNGGIGAQKVLHKLRR